MIHILYSAENHMLQSWSTTYLLNISPARINLPNHFLKDALMIELQTDTGEKLSQ